MEPFERLTSICPPYLHLFVGDTKKLRRLLTLIEQGGEPHPLVKIINGAHCQTPDELFNEFAQIMEFPSYFGYNWAALDECLNDLSWLPANAYIIVIRDFDKVFVNLADDKKTLIDIVIKSAIAWAQGQHFGALKRKPTPFHIVLQCTQQEEEIVRLLKEAKLKEC